MWGINSQGEVQQLAANEGHGQKLVTKIEVKTIPSLEYPVKMQANLFTITISKVLIIPQVLFEFIHQ